MNFLEEKMMLLEKVSRLRQYVSLLSMELLRRIVRRGRRKANEIGKIEPEKVEGQRTFEGRLGFREMENGECRRLEEGLTGEPLTDDPRVTDRLTGELVSGVRLTDLLTGTPSLPVRRPVTGGLYRRAALTPKASLC
ncbi:hypothetical protein E3N88_22383 [Mikania micrantha]|uniref:Uncharacterized protein n=1 Tax=Mikania micrantha TaxID=192012 RepID=A0A5N6NA81_9ASTR|nr:hypothetical protein E3N88_22383 [Mikania micrantha]